MNDNMFKFYHEMFISPPCDSATCTWWEGHGEISRISFGKQISMSLQVELVAFMLLLFKDERAVYVVDTFSWTYQNQRRLWNMNLGFRKISWSFQDLDGI